MKIFTFLVLNFYLIFGSNIYSKNIIANSVNFIDVEKAVSKAVPGDVIFIPAGSANWGTEHNLKVFGGITIIGEGKNRTIIKRSQSSTNPLITFECINGLQSEVYDIGFIGNFFKEDIELYENGTLKRNITLSQGLGFLEGCQDFKVANCSFEGFGNCAICIRDNKDNTTTQRGVVYENEFLDNFYSEVKNYGYGVVVYGDNVWPYDPNPTTRPEPILGTINAVYVEDNFFSGNRHCIASNNASKYVFRYNTVKYTLPVINYAMVDAHGESSAFFGEVPTGSLSYEIYENSFEVNTPEREQVAGRAIGIRGGDGVIFNNKISDKIHRNISLTKEHKNYKIPRCNTNQYETTHLNIWGNEEPKTSYGREITDNQGVFKVCSNIKYTPKKMKTTILFNTLILPETLHLISQQSLQIKIKIILLHL